MDFGKYKRALRAATRPTHLRKVLYDPSIDDTDVDFPDIENPRMFQEGGVVQREGYTKGGAVNTEMQEMLNKVYEGLDFDKYYYGVSPKDKKYNAITNMVQRKRADSSYVPGKEAMKKRSTKLREDAIKKFNAKKTDKPIYSQKLNLVKFKDAEQEEKYLKLLAKKRSQPKNVSKITNRFLAKEFGITEEQAKQINSMLRDKVDSFVKGEDYYKQTGQVSPTKIRDLKAQRRRRKAKQQLEGNVDIASVKDSGIETHHIMPFGGKEKTTAQGLALIDKQMNVEMAPYEIPILRNAERIKEIESQYGRLEEYPKEIQEEIKKINMENRGYVELAKKNLPKKYHGLIGYYEYDPTDVSAPLKKKGINPNKSVVGFKGDDFILKDNPEKTKVLATDIRQQTGDVAANLEIEIANKLRNDAGLQQAALTKYPVCKGRKEGGDLATCIAENLIKDAKKIETGNATQRMVAGNRFKDIVRKGGRKTKDGLRVIQKGLSAGVGGGLGLALEGILEALLVGWDMSANAAPLDEALQANTILASGAVEFLPEGELKESLGGGLISGPSAERLKIEKATASNPAAQRYDQAKQALDEYNTLKKRVENLSRTQLGEDYGAYQEALQKFKDYEEELMFLGDMDEYRKILTPGSYESNEYKRVMTEQASERTGQAYRDRELGMNEGLVDPAAVEQARAEEFKDQTEMIYGDDMTEEEFMNQYRNDFYKFFGEQLGKPGIQPGQSAFADQVIDMHLRNQYNQGLELFGGIRRQQYAGGGLTRRGFLKLMAGIGTTVAAFKAGLVKLKSTVAKQALENAPKGTPDWFAPLVDKIKTEGKDMSDTLATIERESVTVLKVPVLDKLDQPIKVQRSKSGATIEENVTDTYTLYENPDTGEISVRVNSDAGVNNMPVDFNMTPTKITGTTDDGKPIVEPGEFVVVEERAVGRQVGPDDYDIDLDEYVTNDLDDAASDWHSVEEFATGKTDRTAQTKKRVRKDAIENDPTEDVVSRQGELMDYNQGDDYD